MSTILLVCTGNICRSPMAQGFLRQLLAERGAGAIRVESAGVHGWTDSPATPEAVRALEERGIDIRAHLARRLSRAVLDGTGLVLAMASEHREAIVRMVPSAASRTFTIKELVKLLEARESEWAGEVAKAGDPARRIAAAARFADGVRSGPGAPEIFDEDVADPLGLGIEAFRAAAWELGELCLRLANAVFGPAAGQAPAGASHLGWGDARRGVRGRAAPTRPTAMTREDR